MDKDLVEATYDGDGVQVSASIGADGKEYGDPVPMSPPIGYSPEPNIVDLIRSMVRREVSAVAQQEGFETFEEADDFEVDDDELFDKMTEYEKVFEPRAKVEEVKLKSPLPEAPEPVNEPVKSEPAVASPPAGSSAPTPTTPSASTVPST